MFSHTILSTRVFLFSDQLYNVPSISEHLSRVSTQHLLTLYSTIMIVLVTNVI